MPIEVFLFAGPSMFGANIANSGSEHTALGPAKRGDIKNLVSGTDAGVLVLADGFFGERLAVGHRELLEAIERGWEIWGVSSMGAIRAFELRDYGMNGFGRVFEEFSRHEDFTDDELALLHMPAPSYRPISEPLVEIRLFLCDLHASGRLDRRVKEGVLSDLSKRFFADRDLLLFQNLLQYYGVSNVDKLIAEYDNTRVKRQDLRDLLLARPWLQQSEGALRPLGS